MAIDPKIKLPPPGIGGPFAPQKDAGSRTVSASQQPASAPNDCENLDSISPCELKGDGVLAPENRWVPGSAFHCKSKRPEFSPRLWTGPVLTKETLNRHTEKELLKASDGQLRIVPYGCLDPEKPPVLLLHGMGHSFEELSDLAQRLDAAGRQVLFVAFDVNDTEATVNGQELARKLRELQSRGYFPPGARLDIVAHSAGAHTALCALNYLEDPTWLGEPVDIRRCPRAGFGPIRLRAIDTPFGGIAASTENVSPGLIRGAFDLIGRLGWFDLRTSSRVNERLFSTKLTRVDFQWLPADNHDRSRTVANLENDEGAQVADFVLRGKEPDSLFVANTMHALSADQHHYPDFAARVEEASRKGELDSSSGKGMAAGLEEIFYEVWPRFSASHTGILKDDPNDPNDLVDYLVRELGVNVTDD